MRIKCLDMVYEMARNHDRVYFIGSDLGCYNLVEFRKELPGQFIMEGINEAHAIGMAAGMAFESRIVYLNTIATFITRRAFDQIAVDLCMHKVPVRLIGNGGGLVYASLGSTHMAIEDIALMRALPNMTIVCPADAEEMERFMPLTLKWPGPIYIRLGRGSDPVVSKSELGFSIGKGIAYRKGADVLIVTTGTTLQQAVAAADTLAGMGIEASIAHMHTIKPFDSDLILQMAADVQAVVSVEEHTLMGGLGSIVSEMLSEAGIGKRLVRLGIPDIFPDFYGSQEEIMGRLGLDSKGIVAAVVTLLG